MSDSHVLRLGDHVRVIDEDAEARVTAVHPDAQVEVEFLHTGGSGPRRHRYAREALEYVAPEHHRH
ncbi:MAG TPA: hypothetical protein VMD91_15395 [Candidatus Sulfotelmatobacter sp.]|nr:hypothetical protein [Candidatus Sulfotelmatobacter sp.]